MRPASPIAGVAFDDPQGRPVRHGARPEEFGNDRPGWRGRRDRVTVRAPPSAAHRRAEQGAGHHARVEELLGLPFLQPDQVTDSLHAYQIAKRGNSLRVMAEAVRWASAARGSTPSAQASSSPRWHKDELTGSCERVPAHDRVVRGGRAGTSTRAPWARFSWARRWSSPQQRHPTTRRDRRLLVRRALPGPEVRLQRRRTRTARRTCVHRPSHALLLRGKSDSRGGGELRFRFPWRVSHKPGLSAGLDDSGMAQNFIGCDRDQELLLPPSLREWLPEDHLAWFVLEAVGELDLAAFYGAYREDGWGRAAHDPSMMVALLVYAYAIGVRSARGIERRCREDVAFRVLTANQAPDHATIARFRVRHEDAIAGLVGGVLELCAKAGWSRSESLRSTARRSRRRRHTTRRAATSRSPKRSLRRPARPTLARTSSTARRAATSCPRVFARAAIGASGCARPSRRSRPSVQRGPSRSRATAVSASLSARAGSRRSGNSSGA